MEGRGEGASSQGASLKTLKTLTHRLAGCDEGAAAKLACFQIIVGLGSSESKFSKSFFYGRFKLRALLAHVTVMAAGSDKGLNIS